MMLLLKICIAIVVLLYPLAIYFGLQQFEPKYLAILLTILVLVRGLFLSSNLLKHLKGSWFLLMLAGLTIAALSFIQNSTLGLKLYPIIISSSFLLLFTYSLFKPPTVIERLARLQDPDLPDSGIIYTRKVTIVWCCFFIVNIIIASYTVFYTTIETWTLYNGLISYLLMGSLFLGELLYRKCILKV